MQSRPKPSSKGMTKGSRGIVSFFVLFLAIGFLGYHLLFNVVSAFGESAGSGIRSLAAAIFPLTVAIYLGFIARLRVPARESRAPLVNSFVIFLFWTMLVLGVERTLEMAQFPLVELLYSLTLSGMVWRYKYQDSFKSLLACSYGVLAGALAAVIVFGMV